MTTKTKHLIMAIATLIALSTQRPAFAQAQPQAKESPAEFQKRTKWWQEARFGMFIHWGLYAVPADSSQGLAEWYFSNHSEIDPATGGQKKLQVNEYEQFAKRFNPMKFNAKEWVSIAKNAGMKYIVITSKHHDGFAMFQSNVSQYNIAQATPYGKDLMKELADECKRQGIRLCFYHSIMDWHHPDYLPRRDWDKRPIAGANYDRYVQYMKSQLKELLTNYGKIGVLWFDGEWEGTWNHERAADLYHYVRSLQPDIIINNRIDKGRAGMAGMNVSNAFYGDFGTPEQEIPAQGFTDGRLWESCMTLNDTWGYARNDHNWKSSTTLIRQIADIAGKGGNFLLNVGPTELGEFTPETKERLAALGRWTKSNSKAIYGTDPNPFRKMTFQGTATRRGNKLYLIVYHWGEEGAISIAGLMNVVLSAKTLATGEKVTFTSNIGDRTGIHIVKPQNTDPDATVIELTLSSNVKVKTPQTTVNGFTQNGVVQLLAEDATLVGDRIKLEQRGGSPNIGYWTDPLDAIKWKVSMFGEKYEVSLEYACPNDQAGSVLEFGEFNISEGDRSRLVSYKIEGTGGWEQYKTVKLATPLDLTGLSSGEFILSVKAKQIAKEALFNLRSITLKRIARE